MSNDYKEKIDSIGEASAKKKINSEFAGDLIGRGMNLNDVADTLVVIYPTVDSETICEDLRAAEKESYDIQWKEIKANQK